MNSAEYCGLRQIFGNLAIGFAFVYTQDFSRFNCTAGLPVDTPFTTLYLEQTFTSHARSATGRPCGLPV